MRAYLGKVTKNTIFRTGNRAELGAPATIAGHEQGEVLHFALRPKDFDMLEAAVSERFGASSAADPEGK